MKTRISATRASRPAPTSQLWREAIISHSDILARVARSCEAIMLQAEIAGRLVSLAISGRQVRARASKNLPTLIKHMKRTQPAVLRMRLTTPRGRYASVRIVPGQMTFPQEHGI